MRAASVTLVALAALAGGGLVAVAQPTGTPARDPAPVVKLFTPDAGATWLLTEIDPTDYDRAFGLCDLGLGEPELGYVSLGELAAVRGPLRLPIERDAAFTGGKPLSEYAIEARRVRRIVA